MHIDDEIRKCVAFIAWKKPSEDQPRLCGTGFFVGVSFGEDGTRIAIYLRVSGNSQCVNDPTNLTVLVATTMVVTDQ